MEHTAGNLSYKDFILYIFYESIKKKVNFELKYQIYQFATKSII